MQKDPNLRYQNASEMLRDLSLALKKPNEDFVVLATRSDDSPTQKIRYEVKTKLDKIKHDYQPMLSLAKTKDINDIKSFICIPSGYF